MTLDQFWKEARSQIADKRCIPISEIMTDSVITIQRTDSIRTAVDILKTHRLRHLVVVDEANQVRGVFTKRDLLNLGSGSLDRMMMSVATASVITGGMHQCIRQIASLMLDNQIGCVPIISGSQGAKTIAGIVTEADFVKAFALGTACGCGAMKNA